MLTVLDGLEDMGVGDQLLAGLPRTAELDEALEARPALLPLDMPALRSLPTDTLGRAYIDFLDTQGFDPADIPQLDVEDDGTYILNHLRETHDLWHVLTDFDVDTAGEGGLQAFYLAQVPGPLPLVLMEMPPGRLLAPFAAVAAAAVAAFARGRGGAAPAAAAVAVQLADGVRSRRCGGR